MTPPSSGISRADLQSQASLRYLTTFFAFHVRNPQLRRIPHRTLFAQVETHSFSVLETQRAKESEIPEFSTLAFRGSP